jgi:hypothetical protein
MLSFRRSAAVLVFSAAIAAAQPTLTQIQDILYRADGTRFNGTLFIDYNSFQGGDTSTIATAHLTLPIVNGVLKVALAPTTTASPGAQYKITYNSAGRNQFTEVWAVPPSSLVLRVRDVRVSQGTIVGPPPLITAVQISDVTGLVNQLAIRPQEGVGFTIGRAAIINSSGQIDGAAGDLSDCVRVDGSSGPCGSAGGGGLTPSFSDGEVPSGAVNGNNVTFTLVFSPSPAASLDLYRNGLLLKLGTDYSLNGNVITFMVASTPQVGDLLIANYRYANPGNPLGTLSAAEVVCSSGGSSTTSTTLTQLGSCTLPAGLLGAGDRIEVQFQFAHTGTSTGFTGEIHWGGTTVISRGLAPGEAGLSGRITIGLISGAQIWDVQSWGNSSSILAALGNSAEDITQNLTVSLRAQISGTSTDSVVLKNFTVIRYPAQSNP